MFRWAVKFRTVRNGVSGAPTCCLTFRGQARHLLVSPMTYNVVLTTNFLFYFRATLSFGRQTAWRIKIYLSENLLPSVCLKSDVRQRHNFKISCTHTVYKRHNILLQIIHIRVTTVLYGKQIFCFFFF